MKTLACGIECVDMLHQENHCICLGMDPLSDGTDATNATLLREVFRRAGLGEVEHAAHSSVEDRAARCVADLFEHDHDDVCGLHDTDKIGRRMLGDLVRRLNNRVVDPFPAGQAFIKKVHNQVGARVWVAVAVDGWRSRCCCLSLVAGGVLPQVESLA